MTSESIIDSTMQNTHTSTPPKKRRRRAAATGAAEDCFTCRKRQTKCDRRRPYCGQCLEVGKDCSGYKTTLTWGVGVASRGKLRGLTCPVARETSAVESAEAKKSVQATKRKASETKLPSTAKETVFKSTYSDQRSGNSVTLPPTTTYSNNAIKSEIESDHYPSLSLSLPTQTTIWHHQTQTPATTLPQPRTQSLSLSLSHPHSLPSPLSPEECLPLLNTSINQPKDISTFPVSAGTISSAFSDGGFSSTADFPPTPTHHQLQYGDGYHHFSNNPFDTTDLQESAKNEHAATSFFEDTANIQTLAFAQPPHYLQDMDSVPQYPAEHDSYNETDLTGRDIESQLMFDGSLDFSMSLPRSLSFSQFFHLPSRMQYLLDYYDKHICSVLVAFDTPSNPYRQHVLELAVHDTGLQNAIAALAINNMRMRSQEPATTGFIEELGDEHLGYNETKLDSQPTPEESCYKTISINQLQVQLADPRNAQDDSILATLLILCLFHVCDSGFSKFKTQLEGVQKLLSMRDHSVRTGFIGWVEMFFTWFDVMTSTVNDRETEIRGDRLDMMQYSSNLGALEQFSGCDGRLFKLIARLGRLNLLSQNKPVKSQRSGQQTPRPHPPPRKFRAFGPARGQKRKKVDPMDFIKLDGNGWGAPISTSSDEEDVIIREEPVHGADPRHEFWIEWNDLRARLQSWSMNESCNNDVENSSLGPEQRDMIHINEMFRSSALLYTERLAHPHLPSSSPNFQVFVREALNHITSISVTSCVNKFLLWPLFIAGTECVEASDRAHVRERCIEIQRESGFYNNISVLEVLERVWAEQGRDSDGGEFEEVMKRRKDSTEGKDGFGQAFRWRKAMDRVDGEYIIV